MNYLVLRLYDSSSVLDFIIADEATDQYKSHLFYRSKIYREFDWNSNWYRNYRGIMNNPKLWTCIPTTIQTPEEVIPNYPEYFI